MGSFDDISNTGLVLGLGFSTTVDQKSTKILLAGKGPSLGFEPSLTLSLSGDRTYNEQQQAAKKVKNDHQSADLYRQDSAASSYSNASVKRERDAGSEETTEVERVSSRVSDEDDDGSNARKKLRLTKAQSALLEESFKQHSTLNPKQKQDLARDLNLRPRQVEVWFQNRRARTKLKQTEVDCEFLKKCCATLTEENRRLHKELQELKAVKIAQPLYMQLPAATLTMCPSCERIGGVGENPSKNPFTLAQKPHFYNSFTNPSAAC
ncbi:homeobox-leucine zipper protein HAT22-like [Nicotiana sylvestris]|uniref:Homeobox-leucine zipper protein HAT22-like n=1 Tax=Nicotiana sylvestris TaxID=4096 RepID=A0A1U7WDA8_NICSY|nr:PREDICTED: homeobox-leucine zipper protein HAT22-like [Nicotiana sylvestris]